jgi:hypothetical protein
VNVQVSAVRFCLLVSVLVLVVKLGAGGLVAIVVFITMAMKLMTRLTIINGHHDVTTMGPTMMMLHNDGVGGSS